MALSNERFVRVCLAAWRKVFTARRCSAKTLLNPPLTHNFGELFSTPMEHHSLQMDLPRGWYQVAGVTPHTFRRHCLSSKSGSLQLSLLEPASSALEGPDCLALLKDTLVQHDIRVGEPIKTGHELCAAGVMAFAVYKHIGGQREYWLLPHEEATVFACWEMGAMTTAGMERNDIHQMLKKLHFESVEEDGPADDAASMAAPDAEEFEIANVEAELEAGHEG